MKRASISSTECKLSRDTVSTSNFSSSEGTFLYALEKAKKKGYPIFLTYNRLFDLTQTLQAAYDEQNLGGVAVLPQNVMREDED